MMAISATDQFSAHCSKRLRYNWVDFNWESIYSPNLMSARDYFYCIRASVVGANSVSLCFTQSWKCVYHYGKKD